MTSAGTLTKEAADFFSKKFQCPVINRYGSREAGSIACSCDKNEGLHINMMSNYLEILDDNNKCCKAGETGRVIVTLLNEKAMPLIRYDIGDRANFSDKRCSCGRGFKLLGSVNGRTVDVFKTEDGKKVDGEYFTHLLYTIPQVRQFQIVQNKINHVTVKIVLIEPDGDMTFASLLTQNIRMVLGKNTQVDIEKVKEIPVSNSGKRAYTISYIQ